MQYTISSPIRPTSSFRNPCLPAASLSRKFLAQGVTENNSPINISVLSFTLTTPEALVAMGLTLDTLYTHIGNDTHGHRCTCLSAARKWSNTSHWKKYTYPMTCNPCIKVQDCKGNIQDVLHCVGDEPEVAYGMLQFSEVNIAEGDWRNLLIRLRVDSIAHAKLHGVWLHQPNTFTSVARSDTYDNDIIP